MSNHAVIVVGAGISGLAAVYFIKQKNPDVRVTLVDSGDRVGGKMHTVCRNGFIIECGPDGYLARKTAMTDLIRSVGLGDKLVRSQSGTSYIYTRHRLRQMPKGSVMGIPTRLMPMVTTGMFGPIGKLRAAMDLVLPRVYKGKDLSLDEFFGRRLGRQVVENMIEPLLSGIYSGSLKDMSLEATLPRFMQVEQKYRSLILGMNRLAAARPAGQASSGGKKNKKQGMFLTLSCGLEVLAERLAAVADETLLQTKVKACRPGKITLEDGTQRQADAIVLATPPQTIGPLLDFPEAWALTHDRRTSTATVSMAFHKNDVASLNGTGYVISRNEGFRITACSWMDRKWPHVAPEGYALVRTYVGKPDDPDIVHEDDRTIERLALADLRKIGPIGDPLFSVVSRQIDNMPQYTVGHNERIHAFEKKLAGMPGLFACGAMFHGIGMPDCIAHAKTIADHVTGRLKGGDD